MILSYILHGNVPAYKGHHHDDLLHSKLHGRRDLLHLTPDLYAHFQSSLRYSTAALPINTLLDTLLRPNADTEVDSTSLVEWRHEPRRAVSHVALGNAAQSGGQWVHSPVSASWDIATLSYTEMLSLPGYSFADHYRARNGKDVPDFQRPTRSEVADYYASYPAAVGIEDSIRTGAEVSSIARSGPEEGFTVRVGSRTIECRHLVLASGIFSVNIPPPTLLEPLLSIDDPSQPLLVIGSGFSAADVIISAPTDRRIIHVFNWDPENRPSPLKGCHRLAYPEYAGIYHQMRAAARPRVARKKSLPWPESRNWDAVYEGLPNAEIINVNAVGEATANVQIRTSSGAVVSRQVGGLAYVVGRRGSLDYLSSDLLDEILSTPRGYAQNGKVKSVTRAPHALISAKSLRRRAEMSLEVAPNVFIVGSLAGDSLVRHAFGSCVFAAGRIMGAVKSTPQSPTSTTASDGAEELRPNGVAHADLHLNRRKMEDGEA